MQATFCWRFAQPQLSLTPIVSGNFWSYVLTCYHLTVQCANYDDAIQLDFNWEKAHFSYACYLDQLYRDAKQREVCVTCRMCFLVPACSFDLGYPSANCFSLG